MSLYLGSKVAALLDSPYTSAATVTAFLSSNTGAIADYINYVVGTRYFQQTFSRGHVVSLINQVSALSTEFATNAGLLRYLLDTGFLTYFNGIDSLVQGLFTDTERRTLLMQYPSLIPSLYANASLRQLMYNDDSVLGLLETETVLYDAALSSPLVVDGSLLIPSTSTTTYTPINANSIMLRIGVTASTVNTIVRAGRRVGSTVGGLNNNLSVTSTVPVKFVMAAVANQVTFQNSAASRTSTTKVLVV